VEIVAFYHTVKPTTCSSSLALNERLIDTNQHDTEYDRARCTVTNLINLQLAVKRLYWISRATNIPIYYWLPDRCLHWLNNQDTPIFREQLSKLEQSSNLRKIKYILPNVRNYWLSDTDAHWNTEGTSIASDNIWKKINVHIQ